MASTYYKNLSILQITDFASFLTQNIGSVNFSAFNEKMEEYSKQEKLVSVMQAFCALQLIYEPLVIVFNNCLCFFLSHRLPQTTGS